MLFCDEDFLKLTLETERFPFAALFREAKVVFEENINKKDNVKQINFFNPILLFLKIGYSTLNLKRKVFFYILYKIFKKSQSIKDANVNGARATYLSFFKINISKAIKKENTKIQLKFENPIKAEIADISLTSPPPNEYGFLK